MDNEKVTEQLNGEELIPMTESKEPKELKWADQFNWDILIRINGEPGIYIPIGQPNKGGIVRVIQFLGEGKIRYVNVKAIKYLSGHFMYKKDPSEIQSKTLTLEDVYTIQEMMQNLYDFSGGKEIEFEGGRSIEDLHLVKVMTPTTPDHLANPVAYKKVVNWYNYLITNLEKVSNNSQS